MPLNALILKDVADAGLSSWAAAPFLQKVTDIVPSIIYIFNQATQSNEYSNRSLGEALGYSGPEVQAMGAALIPELCHPDDLESIATHFARIATLMDGEVAQVEYRLRHKDGNWVWLLSHDTVFDRDEEGRVQRHIGVASDITVQKHAEAHAQAEHLKATTTNEELRAFTYSLSHDMKSPSNTLDLLLNELLSSHEGTLEEDAVELINLALGTVKRMGTLVDDVLHYSHVINQSCVAEHIDLNPLISSVLDDLRALILAENAHVSVGPLPVVEADPTQIRILFQNLIQNAIKFHKPGVDPIVEIFADGAHSAQTSTITVKDNGIGIEPEKHDHVFTIFKRLSHSVAPEGTGLGLAICRRIAANHGTKITLVSELGNGAAFSTGLNKV